MATKKAPVQIFSSGSLVSASEAFSDVALKSGGNIDLMLLYSGGTISNIDIRKGGQLIASGGSATLLNPYTGGNVELNNVSCCGMSRWYGPALCATGGNISIYGGTYYNNQAGVLNGYSGQGGAMEFYGASAVISGASFTDNAALGSTGGGGALLFIGGTTTLFNTDINGNTAFFGGGFEAYNKAKLIVSGGTVSCNSASMGGGFENFNQASTYMSDVVFESNCATSGGAVWTGSSYLTVSGGKIQNNSALLGGGAVIGAGNSSALIRDTEIIGNTASYDSSSKLGGFGGGVYVTNGTSLNLEKVNFSQNQAEYDLENAWLGGCGGAIANYGIITISDSNFSGNFTEYGGAIYQCAGADNPVTITNTSFYGNHAVYGGGAICNCWGDIIVTGGTMSGNISDVSDGGAVANWGSAVLSDIVFFANTAANGGAVSNAYATDCRITGSTFSQNKAVNGGAVYQDAGSGNLVLENCILSGNLANCGGALWNASVMTLNNVTLSTESDSVYNTGTLIWQGKNYIAAEVSGNGTCVFELSSSTEYVINQLDKFTDGTCTVSIAAGVSSSPLCFSSQTGDWTGNLFLSVDGKSAGYFSITAGQITQGDIVYGEFIYSLNNNSGALTISSTLFPGPRDLQGNGSGLSWSAPQTAEGFLMKFSAKPLAETSTVYSVSGTKLDLFGTPNGTYNWQVACDEYPEIIVNGNTFTVDTRSAGAKLVSETNQYSDIFQAVSNRVWEKGYIAMHQGCKGGWNGTGEFAVIADKNRIDDVFAGSEDANVLLLTDDVNGDALFQEDLFSDNGDMARLSEIDEIRAGKGDDVIDLTGKTYAFSGNEMIIRGGDGNDIIWANSGKNFLFGDAGDDRLCGAEDDDIIAGGAGNDSMQGGGGNDIFCFCADWGNDSIYQLPAGSVTLWFLSGDAQYWNSETKTYCYDGNSVSVSGCDNISLKFGVADDATQFELLKSYGAFDGDSTGIAVKL